MNTLVSLLFLASHGVSLSIPPSLVEEHLASTPPRVPLNESSKDALEMSDGASENNTKMGEDSFRMTRQWILPEFLQNLLPSSLFAAGAEAEAKNRSSPSFLSGILPEIILSRPSVWRVQFYNSDKEDGSSRRVQDDQNNTSNSTVTPNVIFGSPLCLGLCLPFQIYSENTSIHFLSDKQISFYPPGPTPLSIPEPATGHVSPLTESTNSSKASQELPDESYARPFEWLSSWIPIAPSITNLRNSLQLRDLLFPTRISNFIR